MPFFISTQNGLERVFNRQHIRRQQKRWLTTLSPRVCAEIFQIFIHNNVLTVRGQVTRDGGITFFLFQRAW